MTDVTRECGIAKTNAEVRDARTWGWALIHVMRLESNISITYGIGTVIGESGYQIHFVRSWKP